MFATRGWNGFTAQELEEIQRRQAARPRHIKPRKSPHSTNRSDYEQLRQQLLRALTKDDSGDSDSIIANDNVNPGARASITVNSGEFFKSSGCGTWTRV
jgi:hypothetical protein